VSGTARTAVQELNKCAKQVLLKEAKDFIVSLEGSLQRPKENRLPSKSITPDEYGTHPISCLVFSINLCLGFLFFMTIFSF